MSEANLMRQIQMAASKIGARLFRNNIVTAWQGQVYRPTARVQVSVGPQDVVIRNARAINAGLGVGTSDLIGWAPLVISADMIGKRVAIFSSVEIKTKTGRVTPEQKNFLSVVDGEGGLAILARSIEDAVEGINGAGERIRLQGACE